MHAPDPMALPPRSTIIVTRFGPQLRNATAVGAAVAIAIELVGVAFLPSDPGGAPWALILAPVAGLAGGVTAALALPRLIRRAFESFSWLGRAEVDRFEARTGGPVPTDPLAITRWLAEHPLTPATALPHAEILAFAGRFDDARAALGMAPTTPESAFEQASLVQYTTWLETGDAGEAALRQAVEALQPGSAARLAGDVTLALAQARERAMREDPRWSEPLEAVRDRLGASPTRIAIRDTWRPTAVLLGFVALIAGIGASLLRALL